MPKRIWIDLGSRDESLLASKLHVPYAWLCASEIRSFRLVILNWLLGFGYGKRDLMLRYSG